MENQVVLSDKRLSCRIERGADDLQCTLQDKATGATWGPTRLLALEIHDKTLRREERFETYQIERCEAGEDRCHIVVGRADGGVLVGLHLALEEGELVLRIAVPEIYERRPEHFRLFAVDLLPELMQAGPDGTILLPLGSGTTFSPRGKAACEDRFLIYLEQERWELAPLLPICAAHTPQGGLLALASQGACDAQCRVATDGEGRGTVGFATSLRRDWPDPVDVNVRAVRFVPLAGDADLVHAAAARLRRHVVEDLGKTTLRARAEASPEVAYVAEALTTKMSFAQEAEGLEMAGKNGDDPVTWFLGMTFAEAEEGLKRLHQAGIEKVHTQMVGWNARGHDGLYPTRFPIDERLGGERGLRELIAAGQTLGYQISMHDNFMMNIPHAPDWDEECLTHDRYGEPLLHGWWSGGLEYQSWPLAFPRARLQGHLERVRDLGVRGLYYCDYMMQPLEVNYHPRHKGPRSACLAGQVRVWDAAREIFGAVGTEFAPLPAALHCDYVCYASGRKGRAHWPVRALMETTVPLWELALHGLLIKECVGVSWDRVQHQIAFGELPRGQWSYRNFRGNITELDDAAVARFKAVYDLSVKRFGFLRYEALTRWAEPAPGVTETAFSDGTAVTADRNTGELVVNGEDIPCPAALAD